MSHVIDRGSSVKISVETPALNLDSRSVLDSSKNAKSEIMRTIAGKY